MAETDQDLIAQVAAGDREAFARLYDRYAPRVLGLILKIVRNRTDADDVLQEAFLQIWAKAASFDPGRSAPDVWIFLIGRSRALDRLRRLSAAPREGLERSAPDAPDRGLERVEEAHQVQSALGHLPAEQREPIRLAFYHGLTHEQIARQLNVPLGTIKTRIRLGMGRLRDRFVQSHAAEAVP
jgi:RNA polymerase sigma-70 factor (ECF subfamily)